MSGAHPSGDGRAASRGERLRAAARSPSARALAGTILGSAPGLALPFLITLKYGATSLTDAFYFAYAISSFSASLCNGSVAASLLPSLARAREHGGMPAVQARARTLSRQSVLAVGAFHVVMSIAALLVVLFGTPWAGDTQQLTALCLAALSLFVVAVALSTVQVAALQALGDFFSPTASVGLRAMLPVAALLVVPTTGTGLLVLALLTWLGEVLRILWLHRRVRAHARRAEAATDRVLAEGAGPALAAGAAGGLDQSGEQVWARVAHNGVALAVLSANPLVARAIAAHDGPGAVTLIELAERFLFIPWLALSTSVVVVAGARWSRHLAQDDLTALAADYRRTRTRLWLLSTGGAVVLAAAVGGALMVVGDRLVGDRAGELAAMTAVLLVAALPPTIVGILAQRLLTVVGATRPLPAISALGFGVNLAACLAGYVALGLIGIVLGGALARVAMLGASAWSVRRWLTQVADRPVGAPGGAGRGTAAGQAAGAVAMSSVAPVPQPSRPEPTS